MVQSLLGRIPRTPCSTQRSPPKSTGAQLFTVLLKSFQAVKRPEPLSTLQVSLTFMLSGGSPWPAVAQTNITRDSLIRFTSTKRHTRKASGCNGQASSQQPGSPPLRGMGQRDSALASGRPAFSFRLPSYLPCLHALNWPLLPSVPGP